MNRGARLNRKRKIATIIQEDIGVNKEFTVYDIYIGWKKRWGRLPSIKELSKVIPTNPALDRYKLNSQSNTIYTWNGDDLFEYICETEEELIAYKKKKREKREKEELL